MPDVRPAPVASDENTEKFEDFVRTMGLIVSNSFLYGGNHNVTKKAVDDGFSLLTGLLQQIGELVLNVTEEGLTVNGVQVEQKNPLMRSFANTLTNLEVNSFAITKALTRERFEQLIEIMNAKPDELKQAGGFSAVVATLGLEGVRTSKITYVQITEQDVVVNKKALEAVAGEGGKQGAIDGVFAFLKGEVADDEENVGRNIKEVAQHAGEMADVVLRAAVDRREKQPSGGEERFSEVVSEKIKKVYDALMKDPAANTQKGKKDIEKSLGQLEEEVVAKLRGQAGGCDDAVIDEVKEAVEGMRDELKIEALAAEYMKKRKAIETSEQRILRFIKMKGLDNIKESELPEKLTEGGLSEEEWKGLLSKTGMTMHKDVTTLAEQNVDGVVVLGHLAELLSQMENAAKTGAAGGTQGEASGAGPGGSVEGGAPGPAPEMNVAIKEVGEELVAIVADAEQKIDTLISDLKTDMLTEAKGGAGAEKKMKMPRARMMVVLAEIVQELCQPLAVINCSLGLIMSRNIGEVNEQQLDMLNVAMASGEKMKQLANKLMEISGVPTALSPDSAIQSSLYR